MKSVNEVSKLAGVSRRTLHYYDGIGLLKPSGFTGSGYRLYNEADLERLWQIMFYKELDFSLQQISAILDTAEESKLETLRKHKALLLKKQESLNTIIGSIDKILRGEFEENMLNNFDMKEIEAAKREYGGEAQERWGNTEAYRESAKCTGAYTSGDWARIKAAQNAVYDDFIKALDRGFDSAEARETVGRWQKLLNDNFYECSDEMLAGLGRMYAEDARFTKNIDKIKEGLADFMSKSIESYCAAGRPQQ